MREDMEKNSKACSACLNAGNPLEFQIPQRKKTNRRKRRAKGSN